MHQLHCKGHRIMGDTDQSVSTAPVQRLALLLDQRKSAFINVMPRDCHSSESQHCESWSIPKMSRVSLWNYSVRRVEQNFWPYSGSHFCSLWGAWHFHSDWPLIHLLLGEQSESIRKLTIRTGIEFSLLPDNVRNYCFITHFWSFAYLFE